MKKFFLSALCAIGLLSFSSNANAQMLSGIEGMPPYKLGVTAGFNGSKFSESHADMKAGFHVGLDLMLDASDLINNTYARVGLLFQRKGTRYEENVHHNNNRVKTAYLEVPVHYGYAYRIDSDWTVLGETGPYVALGLGGRIHWDNNSDKFFTNDKIGNPKNFDFGWGLGAGVLFQQRHQVKIGYDFGLINMTDVMLQNRNLMIGYTYFFE